jgi:hypothetical protein
VIHFGGRAKWIALSLVGGKEVSCTSIIEVWLRERERERERERVVGVA